MPRKGDYLFKRKGSQNWYVRIQYPPWLAKVEGRNKREVSLGTTDRDEAWIKASEYIKEHKQALFARKVLMRTHEQAQKGPKLFEPGKMHSLAGGGYAAATEEYVIYYDSSLKQIDEAPNTDTMRVPLQMTMQEMREITPYLPAQKNPDDEIIEHWIAHRNIGNHLAAEARRAWSDFKKLTNNRPLIKCTRKDGIAFANLLLSRNNNSSTVEKKIGHLRAAFNLHTMDGTQRNNPFHKVTPVRDDKLKRDRLSSEDMRLVRDNLHALSEQDQLLWKLLATTGMRLDEAFQIREEHLSEDIRYVRVGTKTASSNRNIPLPKQMIDQLPALIDQPLFDGKSSVAGKRLRYFLKRLGISYNSKTGIGDRRKVLHSLRHRAKDRLRESGCPLEVQYELLGHEIVTVAASYGRGSPIKLLLTHIDTIGY